MLEVVAGVASVVVGFVARRRLRPKSKSETMYALRHAGQAADAYRAATAEVACTLDELRVVLDAARLISKMERDDLVIQRGAEQLRIVIPDPRRVTLTSIDIYHAGCETLGFEVALALVPTFGPMRMVDTFWGRFDIDGSQSAEACVALRGERIKAFAQGILDEQAAKADVWSKVSSLDLRSPK